MKWERRQIDGLTIGFIFWRVQSHAYQLRPRRPGGNDLFTNSPPLEHVQNNKVRYSGADYELEPTDTTN